ncbi:hypothetical protein M3Y99_01523900 [Aphelenchoides fujianensis]|nr:hypothetical protein M3Y99_01523900 [Aphelenchoides fujianensis]
MSRPSTSSAPAAAAAAQTPKCLCSIDVHTATLLFGVVQLSFDCFKLLEFFVLLSGESSALLKAVAMVVILLSIGVSAGLLYGNRKGNADFYWPFLLLQGFYVYALGVVACLLVIFTFSSALNGLPEGQMMSWPMLVLYWAVLLFVLPLHAYVGCFVVNRSRQVLAGEVEHAAQPKRAAPAIPPLVRTEKA